MEYRNFGRTGLRVAPFCLGCFNFGNATPEDESIRIIHKALDGGINLIDTANSYSDGESERVVGKALKGNRRNQAILATKVYFPTSDDPNDGGVSRRHIIAAVEGSLRRLKSDWIDLYQIHRPVFDVPQEETLRALDDLIRQGKVRYIGSSTYPAWMVMEALGLSREHGWARFVSEQPPYNLLDRRIENELVPLAQRQDLALIPWAPFGQGLLTGRYRDADRPPEGSRVARLGGIYADRVTPQAVEAATRFVELANEAGVKPAELALIWTKEQPGITAPIVGPRTEAHLDAALAAVEKSLDPDLALMLDELVPPGSAVADFHNNSGWMKPL
jgi:aryl-alcohol dehydrogenase-like predicted oxidoreductase